jgi:hypothetical protein
LKLSTFITKFAHFCEKNTYFARERFAEIVEVLWGGTVVWVRTLVRRHDLLRLIDADEDIGWMRPAGGVDTRSKYLSAQGNHEAIQRRFKYVLW